MCSLGTSTHTHTLKHTHARALTHTFCALHCRRCVSPSSPCAGPFMQLRISKACVDLAPAHIHTHTRTRTHTHFLCTSLSQVCVALLTSCRPFHAAAHFKSMCSLGTSTHTCTRTYTHFLCASLSQVCVALLTSCRLYHAAVLQPSGLSLVLASPQHPS
jgi:hypothetical protein